MMFEEGHPIISLKDWQGFKSWQKFQIGFPSHLIDEVIDRNGTGLLDWFVPLARGGAIASDALLRQAGHHPRMYRPRGWREGSRDYYCQVIRDQGGRWLYGLAVRRCDKHEWWVIERMVADVDEVLVHMFGSTPIFTRSYQAAMRLAMYCHANGPPSDLRWIKTVPNNKQTAIELARKRRIDQALGANSAQPDGHLH